MSDRRLIPDEDDAKALSAPLSIDVVTLFPELILDYCDKSLLGRARGINLVNLRVLDPRRHATDTHNSVDDSPYGGGAGMVITPTVVADCLESEAARRPVFVLSPSGMKFDQRLAEELVTASAFTLVCGRYEGIDERVSSLVDGEISIGDFVLFGGEAAALCIIEATSRLVPGVLGNDGSAAAESFASGLLEHAHYTRPPEFRGMTVPEVLLSGDHARIARFRRADSLLRTVRRRPDLMLGFHPGDDDIASLKEFDLFDEFETLWHGAADL